MKNKMDALVNAFADVLSESEVVTAIQLGKISAVLEISRIEKGMTQKEFAEFMGVSQGMVSKWESEEYNFTVGTLAKICEKLGLELEINMKPQWSSFKVQKDAGFTEWTGKDALIRPEIITINGVA